jgi:RNA polymerase sigma-70 factor (ECF subfamily)
MSPHEIPPDDVETTALLLGRVRKGDMAARERMVRRYLPLLNRWAHGLLPDQARDIYDTGDLAQVTLVKAMGQLDHFEPRRRGAFLSYLRSTLMNQVRDLVRRARSRPGKGELSDDIPSGGRSFLDELAERDLMRVYETALGRLSDEEYKAVVLRIEHEFSYEDLAGALGKPTPNAARMTVTRGLLRLSRLMGEGPPPSRKR